jgi:hypothetical protein
LLVGKAVVGMQKAGVHFNWESRCWYAAKPCVVAYQQQMEDIFISIGWYASAHFKAAYQQWFSKKRMLPVALFLVFKDCLKILQFA